MKYLLLTSLIFIQYTSISQCTDIEIADFSFEEGTFADGNPWLETGFWYRNDGAELSDEYSVNGSYSLCSNAGGAQQYVKVDSNTTYYLSCYVKNGANDPWLRFIINQIYQPVISINSDNWTFISQSLNSGEDTIFNIGFYSASSCFDNFKLTCNPIALSIEAKNENIPIQVFPNPSSTNFTLKPLSICTVKIYDMDGKLVQTKMNVNDSYEFGSEFAPSIYFMHVIKNENVSINKIVKI